MLLCMNGQLFSQDVEMSQYFSAPLHLNPALAGISFGPRVTANYRNQWSAMGDGFNGGYTTYMTGFDMHILKIKGGIGAKFEGDLVANGLLANYKASIIYSQQIKFNRKVAMKIGIEGSYIHSRIKWNDLLWSDMINPYTGFYNNVSIPNPTSEAPPEKLYVHRGDMGAGILVFTEQLYFGFAVNNLLMRNAGFSTGSSYALPVRYVVHFGSNFKLKHRHEARYNIWVSPNVLFENQGKAMQAQATFLAGVSFMYFGVGARYALRNMDAVIGYLGVKKGKFRFGYSYDFTISPLMGRTGGAHELSFSFNWSGGDDNSLNPRKMKGYMPCPDILNF